MLFGSGAPSALVLEQGEAQEKLTLPFEEKLITLQHQSTVRHLPSGFRRERVKPSAPKVDCQLLWKFY